MPLVRPLLCAALLSAALAVGCGGGGDGANAPAPVVTDGGPATLPPPAATTSRADDWTRFGYDAARTNDAPSGLSVSVVRRLAERRVRLRGTVDSSPIYLSRARVRGRMRPLLVMTGGYLGDLPPYQGKVLAIDRRSGRVAHVLNSLCSNRRRIINPSSCGGQQSAIWGRAGAVVDPTSHRIYVTSSNGPFDGRTNWADSVLELSPGAVSL